MLVALQIAVALLLTVGATLAVRSLANLHAIPLGFNATRVVTFGLDAGRNGYDAARSTALYSRLLEQLNRTPGVVAASASTETPMSGLSSNADDFRGWREARLVRSSTGSASDFWICCRFRWWRDGASEARDRNGARVAVINESAARRISAAGRRLAGVFDGSEKTGGTCRWWESSRTRSTTG